MGVFTPISRHAVFFANMQCLLDLLSIFETNFVTSGKLILRRTVGTGWEWWKACNALQWKQNVFLNLFWYFGQHTGYKFILDHEITHSVTTQSFPKNISYKHRDMQTYECAYQGVRNVTFTENVEYVLNKWSPLLRDRRQISLLILSEFKEIN